MEDLTPLLQALDDGAPKTVMPKGRNFHQLDYEGSRGFSGQL